MHRIDDEVDFQVRNLKPKDSIGALQAQEQFV